MIDLSFLESLIQAIDRSSLDSIEIERGGTRIRLAKTPSVAMNGVAPAYAPMAQPAPVVSVPVAPAADAPAETVAGEPAQPEGYLLPGYPKTLPGPCCSWRPARTIQISNIYPTS